MTKNKNDKKTFVISVKEQIEKINYYLVSETSQTKAVKFFKTYDKKHHPKAVDTKVINEYELINNVYTAEQFRELIK